jgi:hypothetical protein
MNKIKALVVAVACCAALTVSAAGLALSVQQNSNQNTEACCDMENCCKDGAMSCCKKKKGKAHALQRRRLGYLAAARVIHAPCPTRKAEH